MRLLIGFMCVIALFGAVYAQGRCERCKLLVEAMRKLQGDITEQSCRTSDYDGEDERICRRLVGAADQISSQVVSSQDICEGLDYCNPPSTGGGSRLPDFDFSIPVPEPETIFTLSFMAILYFMAETMKNLKPVLALGRRKRDLTYIEERTAGIYGEDEFDPLEFIDPTINPSLDMPEELDEYLMKAASNLKCALCKQGISKESPALNALLQQFEQEGTALRMFLCRSLPEKGDQRKCMTDLRQAADTLLKILMSFIGSQESCQRLKSCQVG